MSPRHRKRLILLLALAAGAALLPASAPSHAEDGAPAAQDATADATTVESALATVVSADVALRLWARSETVDSDFRRESLDGLLPEGVPPLHHAGGDLAGQRTLADVESRIADLASRMRRRQQDLVWGSAAPVPEEAPAAPDVAEESFDLRCFSRKTYASHVPRSGIPLAGDGGEAIPDIVEEDDAATLRVPEDRLVAQVVREMQEETATVEVLEDRLFVRATPERLARARLLLARWKRALLDRVSLDVRAIRMSHRLFAELVATSGGLSLSGDADRVLAQALRDGTEAALLAAQTVTGDDGQTVSVRRGEARTYVGDHEVVAVGSASIVDAVVKRLNTGLSVELCPTIDPGRKSVTIDFKAALSQPVGPFAKEALAEGPIELPELALSRLATIASIPLGRGSLVGGSFAEPGPGAEAPLAFVLYVKPALLPLPAEPVAAEAARSVPVGPAPPLASLTKETKAELDRLRAVLPVLEAAGAKARAARVFRADLIDVRDLFSGLRDQLVTRLGLVLPPARTNAGAVPDAASSDSGPSAIDPDRLEQRLKMATGADEVWGGDLPASYESVRGLLIVRQTPGTLAAVQAQLALLRGGRRRPVALEVSLYRLDPAWLAGLEATAESPGAGALPAAAIARLEAATAPSVVYRGGGFVAARSGERSNLFQGRERAFVSSLQGWVSETPPVHGALPVIGIARTGLRLAARVREEDDASRAFAVEANLATARLRELGRSEAPGGSIGTPLLELDDGVTSVTLARGEGILVVRARAPEGVDVVLLKPLVP
jgi:hypothetical protein